LYKAMAGAGQVSAADLAKKTGCRERYLQEWLLNQAAGGYVQYHAGTGKYSISEEQAFCLADPMSPGYVCGAFDVIQSMHRDEPKVEAAFKSGKGIPWGDHDACLFCGTERFFAASYRGNLIGAWIPALDGVNSRLADGAQAADVGCGHGISTMLMAQAFPTSHFVGSICTARRSSARGRRPRRTGSRT